MCVKVGALNQSLSDQACHSAVLICPCTDFKFPVKESFVVALSSLGVVVIISMLAIIKWQDNTYQI